MANFSDVSQDYWAKTAIEKLADENIISGYKDGTFKPDNSLTRGEFAALLNKAFPDKPFIREAIEFTDVASDYWAKEVIQEAYRKGFLTGYEGKIFLPEQEIPRVQVLVALANGLGYKPSQPTEETLTKVFEDAADIPGYGISSVAAAAEKSIVVNYPNVQKLDPNRSSTRAEVAAFLSQALLQEGDTASISDEYIVTVVIEPPLKWNGELLGVAIADEGSDVLFSESEIETALTQLAELKINTVYPTVWNGRYTLYPSREMGRIGEGQVHPKLMKTGVETTSLIGAIGSLLTGSDNLLGVIDDVQQEILSSQSKDSLGEFVARKSDKNLAVIASFEGGFQLQADSQLATSRPNWLARRQDGSQLVEGDVRQDDKYWLNPLHPQVQQFFLQLVIETVSNYDVDGIQLNQYFGLPVEFGYDDFTKQLYREDNLGQEAPDDPKDEGWVKWRAGKLTDFMRQVFWVVKEYNPNSIISLSSLPYEDAYNQYLQDWKTWENVGFVEELLVRVDAENLEDFTAELDKPEVQKALRNIPVAVGILTGTSAAPVEVSKIKERVEAASDRSFTGVFFPDYDSFLKSATATEESKTEFLAIFPELQDRPTDTIA
jgi:uncharacterized lipoprotein YddW (UPF0748 family)